MNILTKPAKGLTNSAKSLHWVKGLLWSLATVIVVALINYFASPEVVKDIPSSLLWAIPAVNAGLLFLKDALDDIRGK